MSINTTTTSDPVAADLTSRAPAMDASALHAGAPHPGVQQAGVPEYEGLSAAVASPPDPALIAKLANEFFAALPGKSVPADAAGTPLPASANSPALPTAVPSHAAIPDLPREVFSFPAVPNMQSIPGAPAWPSTPSPGPLTEVDFRAIAASLTSATGLVPQFPLAAPPPAVPAWPVRVVDGERAGPFSATPVFPSASELHSFPGVPAMPSSPPTAPPSAADLAAASAEPPVHSPDGSRLDPWAVAPAFPVTSELYSFPRVPGASIPGMPEPIAVPPAIPSAPSSTEAVSASTVQSQPVPSVPSATAPPAVPKSEADSSAAEVGSPFTAATAFPSVSRMFSFPGVPGAQSPPGIPVLPSSVPTKPPAESDLRAIALSPAGATAPSSQVSSQIASQVPPQFPIPTAAQSVIPIAAPPSAPAATTVPGNTNLPAGTETLEFHPDVVPALRLAHRPLDPRLVRRDFPILQERVHGRQLIWLDNAATTQKPNAVIDRLSAFYRHENSNIHRAAHDLAARATDAYESAREKTRRFLNASSTREIIFVRGTTEGINLVAQSWGRRNVGKDDEVLITWLEHHANIVPWQQLCSEKGARLRVAPVNDRGEVILEEYERLLGPRTRIVSFSQVSNALGTVTPAREMVEIAHRYGARVLVDGAQAVSHMRVDVQTLDCDFYVFSGHKIFAPTGIGVVYGKVDLLDSMPPWQGGGNMIKDVTFERTTYQVAPMRFEAGTGNIADAVGLGAALDYVEEIGMESIAAYEHELMIYATAGLLTVPGLRLIGTAHEKAGVLSFVLDDVRTEDVGVALNEEGIAVRSGHHCAQPILRRMGVESTVRPSLALYNTREEIDTLVATLLRLQAGRAHRGL